jgi:hypothetical protein
LAREENWMKNEKFFSTFSTFQMEIDLSVYIEFIHYTKKEKIYLMISKTKQETHKVSITQPIVVRCGMLDAPGELKKLHSKC